VWLYRSGLGTRERGGRTRLQKGDSQHTLSTTLVLHVCASHSMFWQITRDLERRRMMPEFALSRRQRGFESRWGHRWGHKIELPLTRSDTATSQPAPPQIDRQGRRNFRRCCLRQRFRSSDFACQKTRLVRRGAVLSRDWTSSGPQGPLAPCNYGPTRRSATTKHCDPL
jgi:hypothetical protein